MEVTSVDAFTILDNNLHSSESDQPSRIQESKQRIKKKL